MSKLLTIMLALSAISTVVESSSYGVADNCNTTPPSPRAVSPEPGCRVTPPSPEPSK